MGGNDLLLCALLADGGNRLLGRVADHPAVVLRQERRDHACLVGAARRDGADGLLRHRADRRAELAGQVDGRERPFVAGRHDDRRRLLDGPGTRLLAEPLAVAGDEDAGDQRLRAGRGDRRNRLVGRVNALARRVAAGLVDADQVRRDNAHGRVAARVRLGMGGRDGMHRLVDPVARRALVELGE
ncbi:hypothetical protein [Methylobacterium sp. 17Sr1-1]|uniref:hypothetical protein n=1 Tax=Methylobacterium sp. 17Sr1-1 TaxID=2202826 RepID=UPI0032B00FF7